MTEDEGLEVLLAAWHTTPIEDTMQIASGMFVGADIGVRGVVARAHYRFLYEQEPPFDDFVEASDWLKQFEGAPK